MAEADGARVDAFLFDGDDELIAIQLRGPDGTRLMEMPHGVTDFDAARALTLQFTKARLLRNLVVHGHVTTLPSQTAQRGLWVLDAWSVVLPHRLRTEDLGEYIEQVNGDFKAGRPWRAWTRIVAAVCWTSVNAIGYLRANLKGNRRGA
jgi:hypothetical protein